MTEKHTLSEVGVEAARSAMSESLGSDEFTNSVWLAAQTAIPAYQEFAVCMGMDAMRLCLGIKPRNFTADEVIRWIRALNPPEAPMERGEDEQ